MKLLQTEQQQELAALLQHVHDVANHTLAPEIRNILAYWLIEIKPKRVRKKVAE